MLRPSCMSIFPFAGDPLRRLGSSWCVRRWALGEFHDGDEEPGPEENDRPNAADYEAVPGSEHLSEVSRASPSPVRSVHAERASPAPSQPAPSEKKSKAAVGQLGPMDTYFHP